MKLNLNRPRPPRLLNCSRLLSWGLALIVAGLATAAKAQCMSQSAGAAASTTAAGTGTAVTALNGTAATFAAGAFRPASGTSLISTPSLTTLGFSQQAMYQQRAAANQRALAQKLAIMRQQAIAKRQTRDAAGDSPALPAKVRRAEMSDAQREASRSYWLTLASLQPDAPSR